MENYYNYFVNKGNHPNKLDILKEEHKYIFEYFNLQTAALIMDKIIDEAKYYNRPFAARIVYNNKIIRQCFVNSYNEKSIKWLGRKERVCLETKHSSYFIFLDNIDTHNYNQMIFDEEYGLCGGSFPIFIKGVPAGAITVSGLRPHENHQVIVKALEKLF